MGIALEDLGRLAIGLETAGAGDSFAAFRGARLDEIGGAFVRLRQEAALRESLKLPTEETVKDLPQDFQAALLAASSILGARWARQWRSCASGWPLLQRIAKGARHGSPLVKREVVLSPPGAGALGAGVEDVYERWVLVVNTHVDEQTKHIDTTWLVADLSQQTRDRAEAATLDGIALAKAIAEGHAHRVKSVSRWAMPADVIRALPRAQREVMERERQ
jgi:hypothetical protein